MAYNSTHTGANVDTAVSFVLDKLKNLFTVSTADNNKILKIVDGEFAWISDGGILDKLKTLFSTSMIDDGKILRIVNGEATWVTIDSAEEVKF